MTATQSKLELVLCLCVVAGLITGCVLFPKSTAVSAFFVTTLIAAGTLAHIKGAAGRKYLALPAGLLVLAVLGLIASFYVAFSTAHAQ